MATKQAVDAEEENGQLLESRREQAAVKSQSEEEKRETRQVQRKEKVPQDKIGKMKVVELKDTLKKMKLSTKGNKQDLRNRLERSVENQTEDEEEESSDEEVDETVVAWKTDDGNGESSDEDDTESENDDKKAAERERAGIARVGRRQSEARADSSRARARDRFTIRDVEESITHFSGDDKLDITKWVEEFEDTSELLEWDELQKFIYAKRLLKGSAKQFVSFQRDIKSWTKLKRRLIREFKTKVSSATIHKQLISRKRQPGESARHYIYAMQEIAGQGGIDADSLIEYIIRGVPDEETNKAILYGANTLSQLKSAFEKYDRMKESVNRKGKFIKQEGVRDKKITRNETNKKVRCFICGSKDHEVKDCLDKDKGPKCFACNEFGHRAVDCRQVRKETTKTVKVNSVVSSSDKLITIEINGICCPALIDTGSEVNLIRQDVYSEIGSPRLVKANKIFTGFGNAVTTPIGKLNVDIKIDGQSCNIEAFVIPNATTSSKIILGDEFLKNVEVSIQRGNITVKVLPTSEACVNSLPIESESGSAAAYEETEHNHVMQLMKIGGNTPDEIDAIEPYKTKIQNLVRDYKPVEKVATNVVTKITLTTEEVVYQRPRRLAPKEREILRVQIDEWLQDDVIRKSRSEYASPVVIVPKKNGKYRVCIDYRELNKRVVKDRFPMPLVDDCIDALTSARVFSVLDLKNGFLHVPVAEECRKYTAFVSPLGQYEFNKTPFGLCNSPASFVRFINEVFENLIQRGVVFVYIDDLIIPGSDETDAFCKLEETLKVASLNGLKINWEKCSFLKKRIEFLGYEIENGYINPSSEKIKAVQRFPEPRTKRDIQCFLGLTGYFRKFVKDYAKIARPLSDILKAAYVFNFGEAQRQAFEALKDSLLREPVLKIYDPTATTELHTDGSKEGYGAVLVQKSDKEKNFHAVHYMSCKTSDAEKKLHSYEIEILAIINALKKLRVYLLGLKFKIVTDCEAFKKTLYKKDLSPKVARWVLILEEYSYEIEHRPGVRLKHADALSRHPVMVIEDKVIAVIRKAQDEEERLRVIKTVVAKEPYEDYFLKNNVLMKKVKERELVVVPISMQTEIIRKTHDNGHFGVRKMAEELKKDYWIPQLEEKLKNFIDCCILCVLAEKKKGKKEGELMSIPKGEKPLTTYHVDHLGPMTTTNKLYKYLLVVVDDFSKFVWLYVTKSTDAKEVVDKLTLQQQVFGNPQRIVSDRGTAFTAREFKNYCESERIEHVLTTVGVPRGNGQVERINRIIIPILTKLSIEAPGKWYKHVRKVQQGINSTYQRSIGTTPFEVLIGTKMRYKEDFEIRKLMDEESVELHNEERDKLRMLAKQNIIKVQEENQRYHNKTCKKATTYKEGDLVVIKRTQFGPGLKIKKKFLGPYKVSRVKRNNRYDVIRIGEDEGPKRTCTAADYMKPYVYTSGTEDRSGTADCGAV